jgi:hypothetical protein
VLSTRFPELGKGHGNDDSSICADGLDWRRIGHNWKLRMSLTYDEALAAAKAFLDAKPFPYPEYRYVPTSGWPIAEGWYFDFQVERVDGQPLQFPGDAFGGAPGYKVLQATGEVRVVGWEEFHQLNIPPG